MGRALDVARIVRLLGVVDLIAIQPEEFLFRAGDPADGMYVVESGEVQILGGGGIYETVGAGGIVGEMAIVDQGRRSASVIAVSHAQLIRIDVPGFIGLVAHDPEFSLAVMQVMVRRLRAMDSRLDPALVA